jgi:hypothetical protein
MYLHTNQLSKQNYQNVQSRSVCVTRLDYSNNPSVVVPQVDRVIVPLRIFFSALGE